MQLVPVVVRVSVSAPRELVASMGNASAQETAVLEGNAYALAQKVAARAVTALSLLSKSYILPAILNRIAGIFGLGKLAKSSKRKRFLKTA